MIFEDLGLSLCKVKTEHLNLFAFNKNIRKFSDIRCSLGGKKRYEGKHNENYCIQCWIFN